VEYTSARPIFQPPVREKVQAFVAQAFALTHYFWFPPAAPGDWDRIEEANRRFFRSARDGTPRDERSVTDPRTIDDDKIRYYRDPLTRLTRMHFPYQELTTGLSAAPPW